MSEELEEEKKKRKPESDEKELSVSLRWFLELLKKANCLEGSWILRTITENSSSPTIGGSAGTFLLRAELQRSLATGIEYRHAFVEEKIRAGLAVQIKAIREQREMSRSEFAKALNKSQSWVSRLEDPNQAIPIIPTLLLVAKTFDVDLDVRFVPFSEMLSRLSRLTPEGFEVKSFEDEFKSGTPR